jgi:hypothetical protein
MVALLGVTDIGALVSVKLGFPADGAWCSVMPMLVNLNSNVY